MIIKDDLVPAVRDLVALLCTGQFSQPLILDVGKRLCRLTDTHYFALLGFARNPLSPRPLLVSNNPPDFLPSYFSVIDKDFLLDSTIGSKTEYVMRRSAEFDLPRNRLFVATVQAARPISDIAYFPIRINAALCAVWAIGRADADSSFLTDGQLDVLRFVMPFLSEAFARSLTPPPPPDAVAYLDEDGVVVQAGAEARAVFESLFGSELIIRKDCDANDCRAAFKRHCAAFARNPLRPGADLLLLKRKGRDFAFRFALLRPNGIRLRGGGVPFLAVTVLDAPHIPDAKRLLGLDCAALRFSLTDRECEIVSGLYKGWGNKRIAAELGIEESTVKRHTHNIYEKTGFASRVELVLGLA